MHIFANQQTRALTANSAFLPKPARTLANAGSEHPLLHLQRAAGNQAALSTVQTKLTLNTPGDRYEQEADAVAEQVMRMPEGEASPPRSGVSALQNSDSELVQRVSANEDPFPEDAVIVEEEAAQEEAVQEEEVQTLRPEGQTSGIAAVSREVLENAPGGTPLETTDRQFMETRIGADFSHVQIHADCHAAALSKSLNARAFTYGRHVFFNEGEYQPQTQEGKRVLAHELTHVLQQGGGQTGLPIQQQVMQRRGTNAPPIVQRLSATGKLLQSGVAPWGEGGPIGANYEVKTDGGSVLTGWRGGMVYRDQYRYWCHGHSLNSYNDFDYSIYSGPPLATVLKDEWKNIPADQTRAGDIAVWTAELNHSARFTDPVITNGQLDADKSRLSTKNGQNPLTTMTLNQIAAVGYGGQGIAVFRHK